MDRGITLSNTKTDPDVVDRIKASARAEGISAASWLRRAAVRALNGSDPAKAEPRRLVVGKG